MARRVFFSFEYSDVTRAMAVRNCAVTKGKEAAGFIDATEFEKLEKQGDSAVKAWIDDQLGGTSVAAVLVGAKTFTSRWVKYEIEQSIKRGNGLLGIDISKIKDFNGNTTDRCGRIPTGYSFSLWYKNDGYANIGGWIETAAKGAGKLTSPVPESEPCAFCAIARGEDRTVEVVCEDESWIAFFPLEPATPGHTMVIPRAHVSDLWAAPVSLVADLMSGVLCVGGAIDSAINPEGMNLITSAGKAAEQTVFHLHLHVVPRWEQDGFGRIWPIEGSTYENAELEERR